jgi:hypothetical protein
MSAVIPTMSAPLSWRKTTPLHNKLGSRAIRFPYALGAALPSPANPQIVNMRFEGVTAMDRIIGFNVAWTNTSSSSPCDFVMTEANTGWISALTYLGVGAVRFSGNMETMPDEINLSFYWTAPLVGSVAYVSLFNNEVVPNYTGPAP